MSSEKYSFDDDLKHIDTSQSDLAKTTTLLMDQKFRRRKTILNKRITVALSTLDTMAKLYDISFFKRWIPYYCEYLTSEGGKGRQDIVDITKFSIDKQNQRYEDMFKMMGNR